jgi:hypothetical protein
MQLHKKGSHLNTLERFYIHKEYTHNNHLNEEYADNNNQIFNTILYMSNNMATTPPPHSATPKPRQKQVSPPYRPIPTHTPVSL